MSNTVSITGHFMDSQGNPIADGTLKIRINTDTVSVDGTQLEYGPLASVPLDNNGDIPAGGLLLYPQALMDPWATYRFDVYNAAGLLVFSQESVIPAGVDPFDISQLSLIQY